MARMDASWIVRLWATRTLAYKLEVNAFAVWTMACMGLRQPAMPPAPIRKTWLAVGRHFIVVAVGRIASIARLDNFQ
jgi:hypothetical protein